MKIQNTINIFCSLIVIYCCATSCDFKKPNKQKIIDQYGLEVINYFYETAFHQDTSKDVLNNVYKWKDDIKVSLQGNLLKNDSLFVKEALAKINALNIPISINLVTDSKKSNLRIIFGNFKTLEDSLKFKLEPKLLGVGYIKNNTKHLTSGIIGIRNDPKVDALDTNESSYLMRKKMILEEITQALGVIGDSYTFYESLFFEANNNIADLSHIDKKTIEFLYDKNVFKDYEIKRKDFEKMFSNELYSSLSTNKLYNLADEYGLDNSDLYSLKKIIFSVKSKEKDVFTKFARKNFLKIYGDSTKDQLDFCKAFAVELSSFSPYFQLEYAEKTTAFNKIPPIVINYKEGEEYKGGVTVGSDYHTSKNMIFPYKITGGIFVNYCNPNKEIMTYSRVTLVHNLSIVASIFNMLGLNFSKESLLDKKLNLKISNKQKSYFKLVYDPRFPSRITKLDYEKLLRKVK
ncbi:DUF2927 domain-containing protein [Flavobacterium undicola]|uniref:DUF2927 domain-containing protein n=1 Tax=Flavobacterium undicola TaxID=1932779 RepID=UPI0013769414|nr:DUF2927 domain-containing protein [Flavobacterium undicola]MBA0882957.1 DUF2927 domain-containing protein [Flavobacterium undicola]